MKVNDTDPRVSAMSEHWALIDDLLGGTDAMRSAGIRRLPRFALEEQTDYAERLKASTLFPAFAETVSQMQSRAFADVATLDGAPDWIESDVWPDVDMQQNNGHVFAREWFALGVSYGVAHVLVDSPMTPEVRTQRDLRETGARPYWMLLHPSRILGWKHDERMRLKQLRLWWAREEELDFGTKTVPQIRVFDLVDGVDETTQRSRQRVIVRVFEKRKNANNQDEWTLVQTIPTEMTAIPLATFCTAKKEGGLIAPPPLKELAHLNVKHWQQQSAKDGLLLTASVAVLVAVGVDPDTKIAIGAKSAISLPAGASLSYCEHSGKAIGSGKESIDDLEAQMKAIGAKLVEPQQGTKTATQAGEEAKQGNSRLGAWVNDFQDAFAALLDITASFRGEETGGRLKMAANLDPDSAPHESMNVLSAMRRDGNLSRATLFAEAKRRGLVSGEVQWEDEQGRIATEGPDNEGTEPQA